MTARSRPKATTSITMTGPFFDRDPRLTFRQNARKMLEAVAQEAARDIRTQLQSTEANRHEIRVGGGRVSDLIEGYATGLRSGRRWVLTSRVHVRNQGFTKARGISLHAAASADERQTHAFRRTTQRVRRSRAANMDELLKGIR